MARYALLPTPGDPAVVTFWKWWFDRTLGDLFDGLLVCYNPPVELQPYSDYMLGLLAQEGVTMFLPGGIIGHGPALEMMVRSERVEDGDVLAFFEDDSIIFRRDQLEHCLDLMDGGAVDIVGSPRGSGSPGLIGAENKRFGHQQANLEMGPNFWPNLFFARKGLLLQTDMNFASYGWQAGQYVPLLDWTPTRDEAGDTMVWMSIQLRALVAEERIRLVPQWHASPNDLVYAREGRGIWDDTCGWFHIGSLSSLPLGRDLLGVTQFIGREADRLEWERRLMYVWLAAEEAARTTPEFTLLDEYEAWITRSAGQLSLNVERMRAWMYVYQKRLGLA